MKLAIKSFSINPLLILLLAFVGQAFFGQELYSQSNPKSQTKNELSLLVGHGQGLFKDMIYSPLNYHQRGTQYTLNYTRQKEKSIFRAQLDFNQDTLLSNTVDRFNARFIMANLHIDYLRKLNKNTGPLDIYLGGKYKTQFTYLSFEDDNAFTFLVAHSLGANAIVEYELSEKHHLHSSLSIPLLTLTVRPPYNVTNEKFQENLSKPFKLLTDGPITSIHDYFAVDWTLGYDYQLSDRFDFKLLYALHYQNLSVEEGLIQARHHLSLGVGYKF